MADTKEEEFQKRALFDLDFEKSENASMNRNQESSDYSVDAARHMADKEKEYEEKQAEFGAETSALKDVSFFLDLARKTDPKLAQQAEAYLDSFMNKDFDKEYGRKTFRKKDKEKDVDLDGSKRGFWGKLKNKAKNFWKPGNTKHMLEESIKKLQQQVSEHPETFESLKQMSRPEGKAFDSSEKVSFEQIIGKQKEVATYYNDQRVEAMHAKGNHMKSAQHFESISQSKQATIDKIHEVRDKAAKEIELRSTARDTTGIRDAQANTGVDRLAEKAKQMEGLSPEQRLALRLSQLRGTSKEEPKQTIKREMDSNMMTRVAQGQTYE